MKDESFCIEFASSLALMLLELNAELLDLADEDFSTTQRSVSLNWSVPVDAGVGSLFDVIYAADIVPYFVF